MKDEALSGRVRTWMRKQRLTQGQLSAATGVSQSAISEMLSCKRSILPLVNAISQHYGVSRDWLMGDAGVLDAYDGTPIDLNVDQRKGLVERLNELYERHQEIIREEQHIMTQMVTINKMLLLGGKEVLI